MNIGIIGSGHVGGTLGTRWAQGGHKVVFSSRRPQSEEMQTLARRAGENARTGTPAEAAATCEVVLLATPWPSTEAAIREAGSLQGKLVIDAVNPILPDLSGLALGTNESAGEKVAQWAAGARVVKCFNTIGANIMGQPEFAGAKPVLFYCGDDAEAKRTVRQLGEELGFDPQDAGPLTQARVLEPFAMLWISLAYGAGFGTNIAFQMLRR